MFFTTICDLPTACALVDHHTSKRLPIKFKVFLEVKQHNNSQ